MCVYIYIYIHMYIYIYIYIFKTPEIPDRPLQPCQRNSLGWLETRLAQNTLDCPRPSLSHTEHSKC